MNAVAAGTHLLLPLMLKAFCISSALTCMVTAGRQPKEKKGTRRLSRRREQPLKKPAIPFFTFKTLMWHHRNDNSHFFK
ncbi:hypothetical protein ACLOJK_011167 [Asimina triloba]